MNEERHENFHFKTPILLSILFYLTNAKGRSSLDIDGEEEDWLVYFKLNVNKRMRADSNDKHKCPSSSLERHTLTYGKGIKRDEHMIINVQHQLHCQ